MCDIAKEKREGRGREELIGTASANSGDNYISDF
jgi:hypothetical protein